MNRKFAILVGLTIAVGACLSCSGGKDKLFVESRILMGTLVEITVAHHAEDIARQAIREALQEIGRVDELLSSFKQGSAVSRINGDGYPGPVTVGEEVFSLIRSAVAMSEASGGAFDITISPVVGLWSFGDGGVVPDKSDLDNKLSLVGYNNLIIDEKSLSVGFALDGMSIDLGGIAAGWAADRALTRLVDLGIRNAMIDAGGELRVIGAKPGKDHWKIGIRHPREEGLLLTIGLTDTAIATSGDYERYFVAGGTRYHHIIDPATGRPAMGCQSVSVLAPTATEADACSTAAFVLGPERGLAFLRSRPGVRGLIVGADGALHWTDESLARMAGR